MRSNNKVSLLFVIGSIFIFQHPVNAKLYKCTKNDGSTTYQNTVCLEGQEEKVPISRQPSDNLNSSVEEYSLSECVASLKKKLNFKDPSSVKIEESGNKTMEIIDYADTRILAYAIPITVNAKNGFGGYAGGRQHVCFYSEHAGKFLEAR